QIYAVDSILRGENAIIKDYDLRKLDLLQRIYEDLPATPINNVAKSAKDKNQEVHAALSIFSFAFYRNFFADQEECSINPVLSQTATSIDENSTDTIDFTITLDEALSSGLTFAVNTSGTATEGTDYETIPDVTINGITGTFSITPTDDAISDVNETINLSLTASSTDSKLCETSLSSSTVTIVDNEAAPSITLTSSASSIAENAIQITLTATSSIISGSDITVSFDTSGTATEGTDYGTISDITISAGSTTGTTPFLPTDDSMYETSTDETATIAIGSVSGGSATENGIQSVTITIEENDSAPTVTLAASSTSIDENSDSSITLTATLSNSTSQDVTVSIGTSGTATEGTDYGTISDITISAGDTTGTASFTPTDDSLYETSTDETATVSITGVSGGSATESGAQAVTLTIEENESAPTVTLSTSGTSIDENSSSVLTLTATLSVATTADVTVTLATSGTATEGTDYTDGSGNIDDLVITAGNTTETISFKPTDDSVYEDDETATISISGVSGGEATESGTQAVSITISENESAPTVTLTTSATSIAENAGSSLTLTATLSVATTADVTVTIGTAGTATEGTDYTDGSGNIDDITISAGSTTGTVSFTPSDDAGDPVYEENETAIISIDGVSGGSAAESGSQSVTITITENESAPTVTLTTSATSINENAGSSLTLTATLSIKVDEAVTVSLSTSGVATEGTDYTDGSGNIDDITISAGSTTGTVSFTPTDDSIYEDDEAATIAIDSVSGGGASENGTQSVSITISENESAPTVTLTTSATSIAENAGSSLTLTATLSGATDETVTVALSTSGTATEGTDYTDGSGNVDDITISAGSTSGTVSFTPTDDSLYDAASNETATIAISGVSGGGASENGTQTVTITITDNESAPTVTLATSATSIAENSASNLTLTATLSGATFQDVTVSISTSGTATEGTDYATISDITISAGSTTGTAVFNPTDDADETDTVTATVAVSGVSGGGASESGSQSVTISILDDESVPRVSLTVSATSIAENAGSSLTLTATLSKTATENVTVTLGTSGTATEGTDYGSLSNITVTAGDTTSTVSFTPSDDSFYDASSNETAVVAIDSVSGGDALEDGTQSITITITDNESAPTITLATSATSIAENAGSSLTLTATLSNATYQDVTVALGTSGAATEGTDYTDGSGNINDITISAGSTTGTVSFTPTDDSFYDAASNETATISVTGVSGGSASESGTQAVTITITDNESAPTVTLSTASTSIDENSTDTITLTATLSNGTYQDVTVSIDGTGGTGTEGTDFGTVSDITISAGSATGTATFDPTDDSVYEGNETAGISVSGVSGGSASESGSQSVTITITENESAPTVTLTTSATSIAENAGSSLTLTATLSVATTADVTVSLGTSGTATEGTDYTDGSGNIDDITISAGSTTGTVNFTPTDDSIYDAASNETATISIDGVSGGSASEDGTQSVTITIIDNESAPAVTLTVSATSIAENAGSSVTVTATLSEKTFADVTVAISTSGTATEGTDYTDGSGNVDDITISAGSTTGTVSFTPTDDSVYEGNESATLAVSSVSGGGASESGTQSKAIQITDNESAPTVTLATSATSIAENAGSSLTLTATLSVATTADVTVSLSTSGTATEGTDYTDGSGNVDDITISAGSTSGTVSFTPTDDSLYDAASNETATIAISGVSGGSATENGTQTVTITITDNESAPTVTLTSSSTAIDENSVSTVTLTATLSNATYQDVTVSIDGTGGTGTEGTDFGTVSDITISAGSVTGTAALDPTDDSVYEGNETAGVSISGVSGGGASESGSQSVTITITENESAPTVALSVSASSIAENAGSSLTITATISGAVDETVTVALGTSGTSTEGTDYTDGSGSVDDITISAGSTTGTVSFTPTNDSTYEGSETAIFAITSVSGGGASEDGTQSETITITDDESAPTVTLTTSATSIAENAGSSLTLTATLSGATDATITVALDTSGTATEGTDYTDGSGNIDDITISAGATTGTVSFTPTDDSIYDAASNETATISINGVSGKTGVAENGTPQAVTITITDNESAPTVTLTTSDTSIAENAGSSLTLTATLTIATYADVTVSIDGTGGTGTEGTDFGTVSDITISAGSTTGTTSFTPTDDSIYDAASNETAGISVSAVNGGSATENGTQAVTITITDNESAPTVTLTTSATSIAENAGTSLTLTATLSNGTYQDVTVALGTAGTSTEGTDYTDGSGNVDDITISGGSTTGTVSFTPTNDSTVEGNETAIISITGVSNGSASENGTQAVTITITDDDSGNFSVADVTAAESVGNATFTVSLSNAFSGSETIDYATSNDTATAGSDYTATSGTLTFSAGDTSKTFTVAVTDDSTDENDETATITISNASDGSISDATATLTITDNDGTPSLSINDVSTSDESSASTNMTVSLSNVSSKTITVDYATSNGTATADSDYTGTSGTLTFSAGETSKTIGVTVLTDSTDENNETVTMTLSNASNASISDSTGTFTITDDDSAPSLSINDVTTSDESNAATNMTVTLSAASGKSVTVDYATSNSTATASSDYTAASGTLTFSAGETSKTIAVTTLADSTDENNETVTMTLSNASNASISDSTGTFTITDDDSAPSLSINDVSTSDESNAATNMTVTLSAASGKSVTVDYATSNGTATASSDYTATSGTLTFSAGQTTKTIGVTVLADSTDEANETVTMTLSSASNATISDATGTFTITDDDGSGTLSINDVTTSNENNTSTNMTVTLSESSGQDVTVNFATSNGTATAGTDYTATSGTLTISAGSTTGTIGITVLADSVYEGDETVTMTLSSPSNATISDSTGTFTINEDESAPTVSLATESTSVYDNGATLTLTASSTQVADEDITVFIDGTGGTATEGTDFAAISNITISAGQTDGTTSFDPTEDTVNEGSETAGISISSVDGADSSTSGTTSVTITITEYALRTATAFADSASDSHTATTRAALVGYNNINIGNPSAVHPYTAMNINDVWAMTDGTNYLLGNGQTIHVADYNCNTNMDLYKGDSKTVHNLDDGGSGESTFQNDVSGDYHCNAVANFAAGNDAGGSDNIPWYGVAPLADLVLSSIPDTEGAFAFDDFAADLDSAKALGATVSNHSWGPCDATQVIGGQTVCVSAADASEFQTFYDTHKNNFSLDQIAGVKAEGGSLSSAQTTSWTTFITALDNFQSTGVIVFANSNYNSDSDASWLSALPQWYNGGTDELGNSVEDLSDAWLSVLFADFTGADMVGITESEFTLKGNPCGKAKEWCLTVDDFELNHPTWYNESTGANNFSTGTGGSSWGAPMVSGGVALVKQAFPNHTPEQIVDRILASANNSWFTPVGNTTFTSHGASITHGYHATWGHGLPDFLAAMSPITSNMNPASVPTGGNLNNIQPDQNNGNNDSLFSSKKHPISQSKLSVPGLLGDALSIGLENEKGYFYDGLNGGFKFDMTSLIFDESTKQKPPAYNMQKDFSKLGKTENTSQFDLGFNPSNALSFTSPEVEMGTYITLESPNAALQKFASYNNGNNFYFGAQKNPFVGKTEGLGINSEYDIGNIKVVLGYHNSEFKGEELQNDLKSETFAASFELDIDKNTKVEFLVGTLDEKDTFLFSKGNGALGYRNTNPNSIFTGLNLGKRINNLSFNFSGTLGQSNMDNATNSLIEGTSNVISSSFNSSISLHKLANKNNKLSFSISQPNRIEQGALKIRIPGLADVNGNIPYAYKDIDLESSGRQLDLSVNYIQSFDNNIDIGINLNQTQDYNHVNDNNSGINLSLVSQYKW
ncbi:hypothetical protein N8080_02850, partial [Alphaproteobacteria bacterium]|nr:hypothetical protein [Alphaproteobacteria bacterium]